MQNTDHTSFIYIHLLSVYMIYWAKWVLIHDVLCRSWQNRFVPFNSQ